MVHRQLSLLWRSLADCKLFFLLLFWSVCARGQQVVSHEAWMRSRLILCDGAVSRVLSGLCGASVGACHISSVHTVALCPARGCSSMGPLTGPPRAFHHTPCGRTTQPRGRVGDSPANNTWQVDRTTGPDQNKSPSVEHLLEINFLSALFFCIHKTQDGERTGWNSQSQDTGLWTWGRRDFFFFFYRTPFALSSSNVHHSNVLPYCKVIEQEAKL